MTRPGPRYNARATTPRPALFPALLASFLSLALCAHVDAQSGGTFALSQTLLANGGGTSSGGTRVLAGTISLVCAGPVPGGEMTGGTVRLRGGFWPEADAPVEDVMFADGFE